MQQKQARHIAIVALIVAIGTAIWWSREVESFLGKPSPAFRCLLNIGTGDCAQLWFIGLHSTNQVASLIFYGALAVFGYCAYSLNAASKGPFRKRPDPPTPPQA